MQPQSRRKASAVSEVTAPRRAQLSRDLIIDAYLRIAEGSDEPVSLSRLGRELDADPTGIYRHFRDKDDLLLSVTDRVQGEILERIPATGSWQHRLRELLAITVSVFVDYPAIAAEAASRTTRRPNEFRIVDLLLGLMREAGLQGDDVVRYYRTTADLILAYAGTRAAYQMLDENTRGGDEASWTREYRAADPRVYPQIAAAGPALAAFDDAQVLQTLTEILVGAIEARGRGARNDGARGRRAGR